MRLVTSSVRLLVAALAFASLLAFGQVRPHAPEHPSGWVDKAPVHARHWMVAAANPLAVDAGYRVLAEGGSAVDAAIAVQLVLGLVEPQSSRHWRRRLHARARRAHATPPCVRRPGGSACARRRPDRFVRNGQPLEFYDAVIGGRSVGVPGVVRLLEETHRKHGRLPWARLFEPAIALADAGFPVSARLHRLAGLERYITQPRLRAYLYDANGKVVADGAMLRNPAYAATLRAIARDGARAFYEGDIARDIVETVTKHPWNPGRHDAARSRRVQGDRA